MFALALDDRKILTNSDIRHLLQVQKGNKYTSLYLRNVQAASKALSKALFCAVHNYYPQLKLLSIGECSNMEKSTVGKFVNPLSPRYLTDLRDLQLWDMVVKRKFSVLLVRGLQLNQTIKSIRLGNLSIHSGHMARIMFDLSKRVVINLARWYMRPV